VISEREVSVSDADLARVQQQFTGKQRQLPPMHSALKKDGKALYEYARAGIEVERDMRDIEVYALDIKPFRPSASMDTAQDAIKIVAKVSKGTYIRTLGEDIGEALHCGAHLSSLRRIETGGLSVSQAVTLAQLEAMSEEERMAALKPVESLLSGHQSVTLDNENAGRFLSGMRRRTSLPDCDRVAVYGEHPRALLGSAHIASGELIPTRLLSPVEISQILTQRMPLAAQASPVLN
jgi:tRNA pseudouridine55 synthase